MTIFTPVERCENFKFGYVCGELYNCCSCGGNDCGCRYCFDCYACDSCKEDE